VQRGFQRECRRGCRRVPGQPVPGWAGLAGAGRGWLGFLGPAGLGWLGWVSSSDHPPTGPPKTLPPHPLHGSNKNTTLVFGCVLRKCILPSELSTEPLKMDSLSVKYHLGASDAQILQSTMSFRVQFNETVPVTWKRLNINKK